MNFIVTAIMVVYIGIFYLLLKAMVEELQKYPGISVKDNYGIIFFLTLLWGPILIIALIEFIVKQIIKLTGGNVNE